MGKTFSSATYAVFTTPQVPRDVFVSSIGKSWDYIFKVWLHQSEYEIAEGPQFELYDERCQTHIDSQIDIYIPVKRRASLVIGRKDEHDLNAYDEVCQWERTEAVKLLSRCGLEAGMTVMDIVCGYVHYTIPAAIATGTYGSVIAIEKLKKIIKHAERRLDEGVKCSKL